MRSAENNLLDLVCSNLHDRLVFAVAMAGQVACLSLKTRHMRSLESMQIARADHSTVVVGASIYALAGVADRRGNCTVSVER